MLLGISGQAIPSLVAASWALFSACLWIKTESSFFAGADKVEVDSNDGENFPFMAILRHDFRAFKVLQWLLESKLRGRPTHYYI